jgi:uncharacterized protein (DUF1015 family)
VAVVHPFRALRPVADHVTDVVAPPYDVISTAEARALSDGKADSFLHVIRPEIALPDGCDEHADEVYAGGAAALAALQKSPRWTRDESPTLYVYRLAMGGREQTGVFACVSTTEYDAGRIVRHENTRVDKEDDRTRHIMEQRAHAEPVMLTYRDDAAVSQIVEETMAAAPLFDLAGPHDSHHTVWSVDAPDTLASAFVSIGSLYIADGHHRCKAASRAAKESPNPSEKASRFPAVLFPMSHMAILPYNRLVFELGTSPEALLETLRGLGDVTQSAPASPTHRERVSLFMKVDGEFCWWGFSLPPSATSAAADQLDVARLQDGVLHPLLGIDDPRTDTNIAFVGGIRGTAELERRVRSGEAQLAISMYPTSIEELIDVSDAGELMPPKSTWFEPKLLSGLLVHLWD